MKRRDLILGSAGLLVPVMGRSAAPCPPSPVNVAGGTSATTACPAASGTTYTTNFPATENPISEGGRWTNGGVFVKTNVQTTAGKAFGTMVSFDQTNFIDSCACLSGFGADQEVTCTIANSGAVAGTEVEVLLRANISSNNAFLYELDCVYGLKGIHLVRWDMTRSNPNSYTQLRAGQSNEAPFNNGDQVYAKIVGTVVTVSYKRSGASGFSTLFTYDTANDSVRYSSGNPGIGFWNETGSAANSSKFAFSSFTANSL